MEQMTPVMEMCNLPLITIGMTAYNAQDSIENALISALSQDWTPTEIIVVNDASTDGTALILARMAEKHENIRIFSLEKNSGVAAARNRIIKESKGEFLAFFDDDDMSDVNRLKKQYMRIMNYESVQANHCDIVCYTARFQNYPDGTVHYEPTVGTAKDSPPPHGAAMARRILYGAPLENGFGSMATCSQMARLGIYKKLGGFDEEFRRCEDTDFNIRLALHGGYFLGIAEPLVKQTMTHGSDKTIGDEKKFHKKLIAKHVSFISDSGMSPSFCDRWLDIKYSLLRGERLAFFSGIIALFARHPILTTRRLLWALPNRKFIGHSQQFYKSFS